MIDSGAIPEAGKSEAGQHVDAMISEVRILLPPDVKMTPPSDGHLDE
jgi:hypothetical protein